MASRFWVGGGSANTWAATGNTNWATTSGGANNASVPTTTDVAVFDSNSGVGNSVIGANITVQGLECDGSTLGTGSYAGTLTHNSSVTLTINTGAANSLRFSSGMTYAPNAVNSIITLTHTSGTANIKSYGKNMAALTINGAGGTTVVVDTPLNVTAVASAKLMVTAGTFDAATNSVAINATTFDSDGAGVRTVSFGGDVTLGGSNCSAGGTVLWKTQTITNLTLNWNSANIIVASPGFANSNSGCLAYMNGSGFNNLTFNDSANPYTINFAMTATLKAISFGNKVSVGMSQNVVLTATSISFPKSTALNPQYIGNNNGCTISIASGNYAFQWIAPQCIAFGGGATFTASNSYNLGWNTGITISPPADATLTPPAGLIAAMASGTVNTGATTTSVTTSALSFNTVAATGVVLNQFVGRVIMFSGTTTTAGLRGVAAVVTGSTASNTPTFTVATLPATPVSGDTFTLI